MNRDNGTNLSDPTDRAGELIEYARRQARQATKAGSADSPPPLPTDSFPGYAVVRLLHRGGQGVVYEAVQESTNRKIALKVMRSGPFASGQETARFEQELRILSQLKHPNIVSLHDGGTAAGHRYLVMDYIAGEALDAHMAGARRSIDETLRLFVKICKAVNAAHLRGVIHRDLKPSNIRVDEHGEPHILDFGLAKLAANDGGVRSSARAMTLTGQFVGSLPWASPEQAEGANDAIDPRTDVYALGLILFHMLTGRFPYDVFGSMRDVLDHIVNTDPARPSTLSREVNDELDTIVLKCLHKDRERRYQSAGELSQDVERYLEGRPIQAKGDSGWYVLSKTLRRHRAVTIAAVIGAMFVVAFAVAMTVFYQRAVTAELLAAQSAADARNKFALAREAVEFLVEEVSNRLTAVAGAGAARKAILEGAFERLEALTEERSGDPLLQDDVARAHRQLGDIAASLGDIDRAESHLLEALTIRKHLAFSYPGNREYQAALSIALVRVGDTAKLRGNVDLMRSHYEEALAIDERLVAHDPSNSHFLDNLSWSYERLGAAALDENQLDRAEEYFRDRLDIAAELVDQERTNAVRVFGLMNAHIHLAGLTNRTGRPVAARKHSELALKLAEQVVSLEPGNPLYQSRLAGQHLRAGKYELQEGSFDAAREHYDIAVAFAENLTRLEPEVMEYQYRLLQCYGLLGELHERRGDLEATGRWYDHLLARISKGGPNESALRAQQLFVLEAFGRLAQQSVDADDVEPANFWYDKLIALAEDVPLDAGDVDHQVRLAGVYGVLARLAAWRGDRVGAIQYYERQRQVAEVAIATAPTSGRARHQLFRAFDGLAQAAYHQNRTNDAAAFTAREIETAQEAIDRGLTLSPLFIREYSNLLRLARPPEFRDYPAALVLAKRAVELTNGELSRPLLSLGLAYESNGDIDASIDTLERALLVTPAADVVLRERIEKALERCVAGVPEGKPATP